MISDMKANTTRGHKEHCFNEPGAHVYTLSSGWGGARTLVSLTAWIYNRFDADLELHN